MTISPAWADVGHRAVRIGCDRQNDKIAVEPFIIWNDDYHYKNVDLSALRSRSELSLGNDRYIVSAKPFPNADKVCRTKSRTVEVTLNGGRLLVTEKTSAQTRYVNAEFRNHIGSAWDAAGLIYQLQSARPGSWQACLGREETAQTLTCTDKRVKTEPVRSGMEDDWAE